MNSINIGRILNILVILLGMTVLLGWYTKNQSLIQIHPSFVPMQFNTALGFLLAGSAFIASTWQFRRVAIALSSAVALLGGLTLIQYGFKVNLFIDELFIEHYITVKSSNPGRMAPNTALCFLLSGITLLIVNRYPRLNSFKQLGSVIAGLGLVAFIGYITGIETAYGWEHLTQMAIHTSVGFILLGASMILWGNVPEQNEGPRHEIWQSTALVIFGLVFVFSLWQSLNAWQVKQIEAKLNSELSYFKYAFELNFKSQIKALERMADRWTASPSIDYSEWHADVNNYITDLVDIQAIEWVDDNLRVRWVLPIEGNEEAVGLKVDLDKTRRLALHSARDTGRTTVSGNIDLVQGGKGFLVYLPLTKQGSFDGYITVVYRIENFLQPFFLSEQFKSNFTMQVYDENELIFRSKQEIETNFDFQADATIQLENVQWKVALLPSQSWVNQTDSRLPELILVGGLIFTLFILALYWLRYQDKSKAIRLAEEIERHMQTKSRLIYEGSRLRSMLQTMADAVILLNDRGYILSFNQAATAMFGYEQDEVLNKHIKMFAPEHFTDENMDDLLFNFAANTFTERSEVMVRCANDKLLPVTVAIARMKLDGHYYYSAIIRDISEQKARSAELSRYTKELERSNRELHDFAYVASHDLKAPLRGITQLATWIKEDLKGNMSIQVGEYLNLMQNRITRLERLLDDLLTYSRVGQQHGQLVTVNINQLVTETFELLDIPKTFKLVCDDNLPEINTLSAPLELIFRNLIDNAYKHHHGKKGVITVSMSTTENGYQFSVCDDGPGIESKYQQQVFGIFQTLKPRDVVEGSGMGLALVKKITETYGVEVQIESDGKTGTCIKFTWPNSQYFEQQIRQGIKE